MQLSVQRVHLLVARDDRAGVSMEILPGYTTRAHGYAGWLTLFCSNFVLVLWVSSFALIAMFAPEGVLADFSLTDWFNP